MCEEEAVKNKVRAELKDEHQTEKMKWTAEVQQLKLQHSQELRDVTLKLETKMENMETKHKGEMAELRAMIKEMGKTRQAADGRWYLQFILFQSIKCFI